MSKKSQLDIDVLHEKIKELSGKDVVELLVSSLDSPVTELEFGSEGYTYEGKCYGGASTNVISKMLSIKDPGDYVSWGLPKEELKESFVKPMYEGFQTEWLCTSHWQILKYFSFAVDSLARGRIDLYNFWVTLNKRLSHLELPDEEYRLPNLTRETYRDCLKEYVKYKNNC